MRHRHIFAALIGALAMASVAIRAFANTLRELPFRMIRAVAHPAHPRIAAYGFKPFFGWSALAYDGPDMDLRHEAGTGRLAAARGI